MPHKTALLAALLLLTLTQPAQAGPKCGKTCDDALLGYKCVDVFCRNGYVCFRKETCKLSRCFLGLCYKCTTRRGRCIKVTVTSTSAPAGPAEESPAKVAARAVTNAPPEEVPREG